MLDCAFAAFLFHSSPPRSLVARRHAAMDARCSLKEAVVITGGTSGIGRAIAQSLAASTDFKVIVTGRQQQQQQQQQQQGQEEESRVTFVPLDLSDLNSVRQSQELLLQELEGCLLTRLVLCAGVFFAPQLKTKDGFESHFQVNHLSQQLLFSMLEPELRKSAAMGGADSRVLFLACGSSLFGQVDMADWAKPEEAVGVRGVSERLRRSCSSKLCNLLGMRQIARQYREQGIVANAIDPGLTSTRHYQHFLPPLLQRLLLGNARVAAILGRIFQVRSAERAAAGAVWLLTTEEVEGITGEYFVQDPLGMRNPRYLTQLPEHVQDEEMAAELWRFCERCVEERR
ncbi:hypothetical protein GUITHDRAFT_122240 [Guillardia theta CCMP2712]|uniref:Uncharacterized protein n=1 Tax=Guillardia theta (strain CCMP2712) TaxID=905079 RepID=L1I643_GUITC|nr:hypothetical protein GUITHDRAFT_122240 [Guillardia theta CCMP2712]EKX31567.1 hypothetical protein GUITHDRAFT_122240 [Guillardia theta CCMP2712]|eukprot:XP_005818547.1 hypothetical protein GUITHDRAFT_122240 [Guillardia theta CCMP2712]